MTLEEWRKDHSSRSELHTVHAYAFISGYHDGEDDERGCHHCCRTVKCLAHVLIRGSEKTTLNSKLLLYMLQVARWISGAALHHRFQLILISADVASLSYEAGSFLCKLKLLDQRRDSWKLWNGQNYACRSLQVIYGAYSSLQKCLFWWFILVSTRRIIRRLQFCGVFVFVVSILLVLHSD